LVTKRLSSTRWHEHKRIFARHHMVYNLLLAMPEFGVAKLVLEDVFGCLERLLVQSLMFKVDAQPWKGFKPFQG